MPTIKKYFLDGDDDISLYMSPKFSITFNWNKEINLVKKKSITNYKKFNKLSQQTSLY